MQEEVERGTRGDGDCQQSWDDNQPRETCNHEASSEIEMLLLCNNGMIVKS